jgi:hypothetical protein
MGRTGPQKITTSNDRLLGTGFRFSPVRGRAGIFGEDTMKVMKAIVTLGALAGIAIVIATWQIRPKPQKLYAGVQLAATTGLEAIRNDMSDDRPGSSDIGLAIRVIDSASKDLLLYRRYAYLASAILVIQSLILFGLFDSGRLRSSDKSVHTDPQSSPLRPDDSDK